MSFVSSTVNSIPVGRS